MHGLRRVGIEVWWDQDMPGVDWQEELARELNSMVAVVVVWTANSANSKYVRDEARLGLHSDKLVNLLLGVTEPPFPFDRVNGLTLEGWNGREPHSGWTRLIKTIEALAVQAGVAEPGQMTDALLRNEREVRAKQEELALAQEAFQEAQSRTAEADEIAKLAGATLARAEEDLGRAGEMRLGSAILRAAQEELDAAHGANQEAVAGLRAAKAQQSETSRTLSRAKTDLERLFSEDIEPPKMKARPRPVEPAVPPPAEPVVVAQAAPPAATAPSPPLAETPAPTATPAPKTNPPARARPPDPIEPKPIPAPERVQRETRPKPSGPPLEWLGRVTAIQWLAVASVPVVLLIGFVALVHKTSPSPVAVSAPAPTIPVISSANAPVTVAAQPAVTGPDAKLLGKWAVEGLTCQMPVIFTADKGGLMRTWAGTTSPVTLEPAAHPGSFRFRAVDGSTYDLDQNDALSLIPPGGLPTGMTRCDG